MNKMWHGHKRVRINFSRLTNCCTLCNKHMNTFSHRSRFRIRKMLFFMLHDRWLCRQDLFPFAHAALTIESLQLNIVWSRLISHEIFHLFKLHGAWCRLRSLCYSMCCCCCCCVMCEWITFFDFRTVIINLVKQKSNVVGGFYKEKKIN